VEHTGRMENPIHIIEPTLETEAGHCHSFIESLCLTGSGEMRSFCVWAGRRARLPRLESSGITVRPHFHRRLRRLQEYILLGKLMKSPGRIFISTAGRIDLVLADRAAGGEIPPGKVYLYVHWIRPTAAKEEVFRKVAGNQPHMVILAPTASVSEVFTGCGFGNTKVVPYPITPMAGSPGDGSTDFRHLLYAGAARQDKGFSSVVELVACLAGLGREIPVVIQASADHYDRYDHRTRSDLSRLESTRYPSLCMYRETLDPFAYADLFRGAICLQPYRREDFADRISGVTLDALSVGCPVIATAGTWMARVVQRFDAGRTLEGMSPQEILDAVDAVRGDYGRYQRNAIIAGRAIQEEHSARHLLSILSGD